MDHMQLMSRLYALLQEASARDFRKASSAVGSSTHLGKALRLLADYRLDFSESDRIPRPQSEGAPPPEEADGLRRSFQDWPLPLALESRLKSIIMSKEFHKTTPELVDRLQAMAVPVKLEKKDSRTRVFSKVMAYLRKASAAERTMALQRIMAILPPSETSRWFDVIRRGE